MISPHKSRFFTLIEIMVVLAIIISLLGWASFNIRSASRQQAFRTQTDRLLNRLKLAQDFLLTLNIESELEFSPEGVKWVPVGNANSGSESFIDREKLNLTAFSEITFEEINGDKKTGTFTLKFLDLGFVMSRGYLKLVAKTGEEGYIALPGYPAPLKLQSTPPNVALQLQEEQELYDRLSAVTLSDVNVQNSWK